ncbi:hypothetical protein PFISCL1PPCAC_12144, partial [Pristionchus fissidentatus]
NRITIEFPSKLAEETMKTLITNHEGVKFIISVRCTMWTHELAKAMDTFGLLLGRPLIDFVRNNSLGGIELNCEHPG